MNRIYLDHNATTPVFPEVRELMSESLKENFGNPSSIHYFGQKSRAAVENSRGIAAELLNAKPSEIIFTGGGTESDNTALFGIVASSNVAQPHIITTEIEHPAILEACDFLSGRGCAISKIKTGPDGRIIAEDVRRNLTPDTVLVSVMLANNELGTVQPVKEISQILEGTSALLHTDAVQCGGKFNIDVEDLGVDLLSLSAHKMNGPKGVGLLYVRDGVNIPPYIMGGHQEKGIRAGTECVASIEGFGKAAQLWMSKGGELKNSICNLRNVLESRIINEIPGTVVNGCTANRVCNTSNISFESVDGGALVINLDMKGICVSSGSACFSGSSEPSKILRSLGYSKERSRSALRISLGINLDDSDIERAFSSISNAVKEIRSI